MKNNIMYDLIVVGASISGQETARAYAEIFKKENKPYKVVLLDKATFPRRKACASGITIRAIEEFPHTKPQTDCFIYKSSMISPNLQEKITFYSTNLDKPLIAMGLNRNDLDYKLLNYLISTTDCEVKTGTEAIEVEIQKDRVIVHTKDGKKYSGLVVVGADSTVSRVAKCLRIGLYDPKLKSKRNDILNISIERDILMDNSEKAKKRELEVLTYNCYKDVKGYAWVFPKTDRINVGVIVTLKDGNKLHRLLEDFQNYLVEIGVIPKDLPKENYGKIAGAMLPARKLYKKRIEDRVILVGDASGACSPSSGEGILPSLQTGKIAGEVIASLVKKHRAMKEKNHNYDNLFSKSNLKSYVKLTDKLLKKDLKLLYMAQKVISDVGFNNQLLKWCKEDETLRNKFFEVFYGNKPTLSFKLSFASKYVKFKLKKKN